MQRHIRVLLADDRSRSREGLRALLATVRLNAHGDVRSEVEVIGEAVDGQEAVRLVEECHPDVVLMDARMPVMDGLEATRRIKGNWPAVRVIMLDVRFLSKRSPGCWGRCLRQQGRPARTVARGHTDHQSNRSLSARTLRSACCVLRAACCVLRQGYWPRLTARHRRLELAIDFAFRQGHVVLNPAHFGGRVQCLQGTLLQRL